jgi:hypothetical protein
VKTICESFGFSVKDEGILSLLGKQVMKTFPGKFINVDEMFPYPSCFAMYLHSTNGFFLL